MNSCDASTPTGCLIRSVRLRPPNPRRQAERRAEEYCHDVDTLKVQKKNLIVRLTAAEASLAQMKESALLNSLVEAKVRHTGPAPGISVRLLYKFFAM